MSKLKILYKTRDWFAPYENNSRTHTKSQVKQIADSIQQFGFTNPILATSEGTVIAGHGRLMAAATLNLDDIPVIILDGLTPEQQRAYVIADNKLALNAGWDYEMLAAEIDALNDTGFDVSLLGFSSAEINDMIGTPVTPPDPDDQDIDQDDDKQKLTFSLDSDQLMTVTRALNHGMKIGHLDTANTPKANGGALAFIAEMFLTQNPINN
jgi:ParB-like chromosome segregation protein Spo0J